MKGIDELYRAVVALIWAGDLSEMAKWRAWPIAALRIGHAVLRDLLEGQISLRAMSLVYTTLLSLVPLLAVSFSVLKGFGVHNNIEPLLADLFEPFGPEGVEITERIVGFVANVKVGVLGSVGLALLFYIVIALMQKIERAFNYSWRVSQHRSFAQRFSNYLSVIIVGPVLIFSSIGITATLTSLPVLESLSAMEPFGFLIELAGRMVPYGMVIIAFTFIYVFMPNTRVRVGSALVGALVAAILWQTMGWVFANYIAGSSNYSAVYSAFSALIIFMIWLYLGWLILLTGALVAFYHQNPERGLIGKVTVVLGSRARESMALALSALVARAFANGRTPENSDALAAECGVATDVVSPVLDDLVRDGILRCTSDAPAGYVPARPPESISLTSILNAVRARPASEPVQAVALNAVEDVMVRIEDAVSRELDVQNLRELAAMVKER